MPEEGPSATHDHQESRQVGTPPPRRIAVGSLAARLIQRERAQARLPWPGLRPLDPRKR